MDTSEAIVVWQLLPEQLLAHLMSSMDCVAFRRARLVCHLWADVGLEVLRGAAIVGSRDTSRAFAPRLATLTGLEQLAVTGPCDLHRLASGISDLQRLESLSLVSCRVNESWVAASLPPSVSRLAFSHSPEVTDAVASSLSAALPGLRSLSLSDCHSLTGAGMVALTRLTNLSTLRIRRCDNIPKDAVASALGHLQGIASLDLSHSAQVGGRVMARISEMTGLTNLCLEGCSRLSSRHLTCLKPLARLSCLDLCSCPGVTDRGLQALGELPALQELHMRHCNSVTDEGLSHLTRLTNLRQLHLSCWSKRVTDAGVSSVAQLTGLSALSLHNCSQEVTADGLKMLSSLINISSLSLTTCYMYEAGISVLSGLTGLASLDLSWCSNISASQLQLLRSFHGLKELVLACCLGVDDCVMAEIGSLPKLSLLDISYCHRISDEGLVAITGLTSLTKLYVSCRLGVSDIGLKSLGTLSSLTTLRLIDGRPGVTANGIAALGTLPSLSRLELLSFPELVDHDLAACLKIPSLEILALFNCNGITHTGRAALQPRVWVQDLKL